MISVSYTHLDVYKRQEDELSIRNVYLYRKRNKYLTKAMEEFIHLVTGESHG